MPKLKLTSLPSDLVNLASAKLGARAVYASDDFFGDKSRLLQDSEPIFIDGKFDDHGKWMDGWESRRRRGSGYDHCIVKLARVGTVKKVVLDTTHFSGNYPPEADLEGCLSDADIPAADVKWHRLVERTAVEGDSVRLFDVDLDRSISHVRLNIYPDGGVARLKVLGKPRCDWDMANGADRLHDLAARLNGGRAIYCNDQHFGSMHYLIGPGRGINMGDGWETRRRREPGNDWVVLALGTAGTISKVVIDTAHFKGNYPDSCTLKAAYLPTASDDQIIKLSNTWKELMPAQKLAMDRIHTFESAVLDSGPVTHVRMDIFPDGGVSRLRLFGTPKLR